MASDEPLKWEIWYSDGSVVRDCDCAVQNVPKRGVECIVMECRTHGRIVCPADHYYVWNLYDGEYQWQGVNEHGFIDYMIEPGWKLALYGRTIGNLEYAAILNKAMNSEYLPQKTARFARERTA